MKIEIGDYEIVLSVSRRDRFEKVRSLATGGCYIQAIKEYRAVSGASLKDAKDFVDAIPGLVRPRF